jgi:hypothetical protein
MEINREMLLQSFREETEECLVQMEQLLLALETHPEDRELVSSLFRTAHTIKGNASLLDFYWIFAETTLSFCHGKRLISCCRPWIPSGKWPSERSRVKKACFRNTRQ